MHRLPLSLAAVLLFALAPASASAQSTHQHDLQIDKKEQFVALNGLERTTKTLSCDSGHIALNGSVVVSAVDSPGHPLFVRTIVSRGFGPAGWRFVVENGNLQGRAQIKLFIVCMRAKTESANSHQHDVLLSEPGTDPATATAETSTTFDDQGAIAAGTAERSPACPGTAPASSTERDPTLFAVRPGIASTSGLAIYGSTPNVFAFTGTGNPFGFLASSWTFSFDTGGDDVAANVIASIRCLGTHVGPFAGHHHAWDVSYQRTSVRVSSRTREYKQTLGCPKRIGSFGIVGAWFGGDGNLAGVTGWEPQGDQSVFYLANRNSSGSVTVELGVVCLEKRTWQSNGSFPAPSPKPQTVETQVTTKRVSVGRGSASAAASRAFTVRCANRSHYVLSGTASLDSLSAGDIGALKNVDLVESRASDFHRWRFRVLNESVGRARLTLRLVCLAPWTEGHAMVISDDAEDTLKAGKVGCENGSFPVRAGYAGSASPRVFTAAGKGWRFGFGKRSDASVSCVFDQTTLRANHYHDVGSTVRTKRVKLEPGIGTPAFVSCPSGQRAVQPTLDLSGTDAFVVESRPAGRRWIYNIVSLDRPGTVRVGAVCLGAKTSGEIFD